MSAIEEITLTEKSQNMLLETLQSLKESTYKLPEFINQTVTILRIGNFVVGLIAITLLVSLYILISNHIKRLEEKEKEKEKEQEKEQEEPVVEPFINRCKI